MYMQERLLSKEKKTNVGLNEEKSSGNFDPFFNQRSGSGEAIENVNSLPTDGQIDGGWTNHLSFELM